MEQILSAIPTWGNQVDTYKYEPGRTQTTGTSDAIWSMMYKIINQTNKIIHAVPAAQGDEAIKNQILGQAKAIRGICYFHLIQNYQQTYMIAKEKKGVILRLDPKEDLNLPRATVQQVYDQILADLGEAKALLKGFDRPDKWTINEDIVSGQLARVYLVMNNWQGALTEASTVYNKYSQLMTRDQYRSGFDDAITNAYPEVVWAMKFTTTNNLGAVRSLISGITKMKNMVRGIQMGRFMPSWISSQMDSTKNCLKRQKIVTNSGSVRKMQIKNGLPNGHTINISIMVMPMVRSKETHDQRLH
ncbi:RagB/SusD family nutrient uptake outer membrane protein [Sphingobacterium sp. E70]|nr:RagB/SusD family nutrient uptake outer membrane protein [Sphingobacterium sp. E70]ULT26541.1 RagB/SusD family nutrient uptake outer membrane protein [Sphingobacterium sp. E70]